MIDLEGGEYNALMGASEFIKKDKESAPIIIFEIHNNYVDWSNGLEETDICKYLINNGYYLYSIRDFQSNYDMKEKKIELIPAKLTYLKGPKHGFNMIAVKNTNLLNNRNIVFVENVSPKLLLHRDKKLHYPIS